MVARNILGWWFLAVLLMCIPLCAGRMSSYDSQIMYDVTKGIVNRGTFLVHPIDPLGLNTPFSGYGIGMSLLMAPLYAIGKILGRPEAMTSEIGAFVTAGLATAALVLCRRRGASTRVAVVTSALLMLATPLVAYTGTQFSEPALALAILLAIIGIDSAEHGRWQGAAGAGAAVGFAVMLRSDSLLLVAPVMLLATLAVSPRRLTSAIIFGVSAAPFIAGWAAYNAARFGSPLVSGYPGQTFSHPWTAGVVGLLVSPRKSVFLYAPILLAAFAAMRHKREWVTVMAITLLLVRVAFYASWWSWYGGNSFGPRFLLPALVAFAPLLATAVDRWRRSPAFAGLVIASVSIQMVGVGVIHDTVRNAYAAEPVAIDGNGTDFMRTVTTRGYVRQTDSIMFDWSRFPAG